MSRSSEAANLPEYLRTRMAEVGIASIRGLAHRVGVAPETARRLLNAAAVPDELTLRKLAEGLPAPLQLLRGLAGRPPGERTPFVLPPEADQLDQEQRSVVVAMVRALLASSHGMNRATERSYPRLVGRPRDPNGRGDTPPK